MEPFRWQGIDIYGHKREGVAVAQSVAAVTQQLKVQGIALLHCEQTERCAKKRWLLLARRAARLSTREQARLFESVRVLLENGMDMLGALQVTVRQPDLAKAHGVLRAMIEQVRAGKPFAQALHEQRCFDGLVIALVRAGEQAGLLERTLWYVQHYLEGRSAMRATVRAAMTVPAVTLCACGMLMVFLCTVIIPRFSGLFASMHGTLPVLTRVVFACSDWLAEWGLWFFLFWLTLCIVGVCVVRSVTAVRAHVHRAIWSVPVLRVLAMQWYSIALLHVLAVYLRVDTPLSEAVRLAAHSVHNQHYRAVIVQCAQDMQRGSVCSNVFEQLNDRYMPSMVTALLVLGEHTGTLPAMLDKALCVLEQVFNAHVQRVQRWLQPTLLLLVGALIALVLAGIYIPIFTFAQLL